ncbi:hypothetical protein [Candidatus Stoquefichus massiliensis]|uniref:hypothetical protein n=1 Tax=Candidatus Stoquefichus massiliensis TaxID=1470350 RepID=UPI000489731D|nr:hypothetical protein [Candidatus Stoquefichus massiliensis]
MLKLMKYEFIHSMRTFFIAFGVFLLGCLIFPFFVTLQIFVNIPVISVIFGIGFSVLILGICIALFVSIFMNYYRSMFGKPSYLTLTLPVTSLQLIVAKVIMSIVWLVIGMFILVAGMFLMTITMALLENSLNLMDLWRGLGIMAYEFMSYIASNPVQLIVNILVFGTTLIFIVTSIYFSLTLTHTKWLRKHRVLFGVAVYFALNFIIEWMMDMCFGVYFTDTFSIGLALFYLVLDIGFIFATTYIVDHYIEIE